MTLVYAKLNGGARTCAQSAASGRMAHASASLAIKRVNVSANLIVLLMRVHVNIHING